MLRGRTFNNRKSNNQYLVITSYSGNNYDVSITNDFCKTINTFSSMNSCLDGYKFNNISNDGKVILIKSSNNYGYISNDYGQSWTGPIVITGVIEVLYSSMSSNGQYILIVDKSGYAYKSIDYGQTWSMIDQDLYDYADRCFVSSDGKLFYILKFISSGSEYGQGFTKSTDFGSTWVATTPVGYISTNDAVCYSDSGQYIYISSSPGTLYTSSDFGETYTSQIFSIASMQCSSDGSKVLVTSSSGVLFISTDYGANFKSFADFTQAIGLYISNDGKIIIADVYDDPYSTIITRDGGVTWEETGLEQSYVTSSKQ